MNIENSCAFTGHRPSNLPGGYNPKSKLNNKLLLELRTIIIGHIEHANVDTFISGMALGIDMWAARIVLALKKKYDLKLIATVPCKNQHAMWQIRNKKEWRDIINQCDDVHYISDEEYTSWCMQERNKWMVDNSNYVIAVYDGSKGGTANCVEYAEKKDRIITRLDPKTLLKEGNNDFRN